VSEQKSMTKNIFCCAVLTLIFVSVHFTEAQQPKKVPG
jgi:hypothetical protein